MVGSGETIVKESFVTFTGVKKWIMEHVIQLLHSTGEHNVTGLSSTFCSSALDITISEEEIVYKL